MTKIELLNELALAPQRIATAATELMDARVKLVAAEAKGKNREAKLLLDGDVDGKNAEVRAAQLHEATSVERIEIEIESSVVEAKRIQLDFERNRFEVLKEIAALAQSLEIDWEALELPNFAL